jgi:Type I restriction enzyme HindI endonuclease subunit-like, C-terminal
MWLVRVVASIKNSVTVDWMHRDATRARMRVLVKKILRKYGYPPIFRTPLYRLYCNKPKHSRCPEPYFRSSIVLFLERDPENS